MVIFIREEVAKAGREQSTFARPAPRTVVKSELHAFKLETVVIGLEVVVGHRLSSRRAHARDRKARAAAHRREAALVPTPVAGVPAVWAKAQGGLLDVAVHPDYATNGSIYLSYRDPATRRVGDDRDRPRQAQGRRVRRQQTIYKAPPNSIGPAGITSAPASSSTTATCSSRSANAASRTTRRTLSRPNGKVHRVYDDGRVPEDNPFVGKAGALATIWSYGHRNPQGLAHGSGHRPALRRRARPARRRRAEPRAEGPQLRLARHHLRDELRRHADHEPDRQGREWSSR